MGYSAVWLYNLWLASCERSWTRLSEPLRGVANCIIPIMTQPETIGQGAQDHTTWGQGSLLAATTIFRCEQSFRDSCCVRRTSRRVHLILPPVAAPPTAAAYASTIREEIYRGIGRRWCRHTTPFSSPTTHGRDPPSCIRRSGPIIGCRDHICKRARRAAASHRGWYPRGPGGRAISIRGALLHPRISEVCQCDAGGRRRWRRPRVCRGSRSSATPRRQWTRVGTCWAKR